MTTALVTGGAGFVGSRLTARLLNDGGRVVIIDNFNPYYDPAIKRSNVEWLRGLGGERLTVVEADIRDEDSVRQLFADHDIRQVAHLAAMAGVRASTDQGRLYADVNTAATVTLLDEARKHAVELFVMASTSSVYGQTKRIPFVETDAPDMPLAPYPASKRAAEIFAYSYHQLFGLNVNVLRFFNVYGPAGRPDMMPMRVIKAILNDETIPVFGEGKLQRDWTYIDDTVDGVLAALSRPMGHEVMNLGFGAPLPLMDFINIYEDLIGKDAKIDFVPAPPTEPDITYCDNTRARELLGFDPQINIAEGLARTWAWYQKQFGV